MVQHPPHFLHLLRHSDLLPHDELELAGTQPTITVAQLPVARDAVEVGLSHVQLGLERLHREGYPSAAEQKSFHIAGYHSRTTSSLPLHFYGIEIRVKTNTARLRRVCGSDLRRRS
jgi:hypothetical protein